MTNTYKFVVVVVVVVRYEPIRNYVSLIKENIIVFVNFIPHLSDGRQAKWFMVKHFFCFKIFSKATEARDTRFVGNFAMFVGNLHID